MYRRVEPADFVARARDLRQQATPAEQAMWQLLRDRSFHGLKFRRQVPLHGYIADFFCPRLRLVIELDGGVHDEREQQLKDDDRDADLRVHGYAVVRFRNRQVLEEPAEVLRVLERWLEEWVGR